MEEGKFQTLAGDSVTYARLTVAGLPAFHPVGAVGAVFADTELVTKVILLTVKLTPEPRAALDAVHGRHGAVAGLAQPCGAHPAAAAVVQHCPLAAQAAFALGAVAALGAVHRILGAPGGRQVRRDQECGQQQEALHVSPRALARLPADGVVFAGGKQLSKVVAEPLPTRL